MRIYMLHFVLHCVAFYILVRQMYAVKVYNKMSTNAVNKGNAVKTTFPDKWKQWGSNP